MEQSMYVRTLRQEDIAQVVEIENNTFSMPWTKRDFEAVLNHPQNLYLVVEKEGEILGYCGLMAVLEEGQITNVAVKKEYRHMGIGFCMMQTLLLEGQKMGLTAFTLEVRESNHSARSLYKKLGFTEAGIRPGFYDKPKEDAVIMWYYS